MSAKKPVRIYISSNPDLINHARSLSALLDRIQSSGLQKFQLRIVNVPSSHFEYPALNQMWRDSLEEDFYALYLHCKGSSKADEEAFQNGLAWMHYMAVGVIDNYQICLKHLDLGADLVGSMWYRHFKGNFFWAKSSYLRTLFDPSAFGCLNRYDAEFWCAQFYFYRTSAIRPRVKNLFYLPTVNDDHYVSLLRNGYVPNLYNRTLCTHLAKVKASNNFMIYDDIVLNGESDEDVAAYSNYNSNFYSWPPQKLP